MPVVRKKPSGSPSLFGKKKAEPEPAPKKGRSSKADDKPPKPPQNPYSLLPIQGEPPPMLREGDALIEIQQTYPEYTVTLDAGSYWMVRRMVENAALTAHTNPVRRAMVPEHYACALRTAEAFRRSHDALNARHEAPRARRTLKKR